MKKSFLLLIVLVACMLTACTKTNSSKSDTKSETITYKEYTVQFDGVTKEQIEYVNVVPEVHLKKGKLYEEGYNFSFETLLTDLVSYKDVKKAQNWADWHIGLTDGKLVGYTDGAVGVSTYLCDERISMGEEKPDGEIRQFYRVVWGSEDSTTIAMIDFPYGYSKEDVNKVISNIHVKLK